MRHPGDTVGSLDPGRVEDAVVRLVGAMAPVPVAPVELDHALIGDLGYHSLRLIELAFVLEDLFTTASTAEPEYPLVGTVRDLVDYVTGRLAAGDGVVPSREDVDALIAQL
jgi:hypothetical protein